MDIINSIALAPVVRPLLSRVQLFLSDVQGILILYIRVSERTEKFWIELSMTFCEVHVSIYLFIISGTQKITAEK